MLEPKKRKYRKDFRGKVKRISTRGTNLAFGEYGLKILDSGWLSARQIEAARRATTNSLKRKGRVWLRIFPHKPVSKRSAGQRMGGGKGDVDHYVAVVTPGRIILEVAGVSQEVATTALKRAAAKLSFKAKVVSREEKR